MSVGERRALIEPGHPELSLSRQCHLLGVSRSSLYREPKGESEENRAWMRRIDELFLEYPFYGSRQMARHLRREGIRVGRHRVRRLTRLMGLEAMYQAPRTTRPHPEHRGYPYLLKGVAIERPNQATTGGQVRPDSKITRTQQRPPLHFSLLWLYSSRDEKRKISENTGGPRDRCGSRPTPQRAERAGRDCRA